MRRSAVTWVWLDVATKVATVAILAIALLIPSLPQFEGKAFEARAVAYPVALLAVPGLWWILGRGRIAFPVAADLLIGMPFLIDVAGNAANLYDTIDWWDDANHLVNWGLHTAGIGILLRLTGLAPAVRAGLGIAWAAVTAILWELAEFATFVQDSPEAATAYRDTLGDLALGLLGGVIASAIVAWWPRSRAPDPGSTESPGR